jgi:hypothetical protein
MKSINIKGKEYITVNERLKHFRSSPDFKGWSITESIESLTEKEGIFKVSIKDSNGITMVNAHAQEYRDSSYINKTSFVENGFTSALGRALGYLGIGIDTSIASAQEMQNAIHNQENPKKEKDNRPWLNETQLRSTLTGTKKQAESVVKNFRMKKEYRSTIEAKFKF